jgi:hypothetical protein
MRRCFCRCRGIRVPSVPGLRGGPGQRKLGLTHDPHPNRLQSLPRGRPKTSHTPSFRGRFGPDWTWGLGSRRGRCANTRSPLKSLAQTASGPTPDEGCDPVKLHVVSLLHGHDISRSEPTRQHEVKPTQCNDGHAKLASGRDHIATV